MAEIVVVERKPLERNWGKREGESALCIPCTETREIQQRENRPSKKMCSTYWTIGDSSACFRKTKSAGEEWKQNKRGGREGLPIPRKENHHDPPPPPIERDPCRLRPIVTANDVNRVKVEAFPRMEIKYSNERRNTSTRLGCSYIFAVALVHPSCSHVTWKWKGRGKKGNDAVVDRRL